MAKYFRYTKGISDGVVRDINPHRFNGGEIVHLSDTVIRIDDTDVQISEWVGVQNCNPVELSIDESASADKAWSKSNGELYGEYMVPFMNADALGMLQVKAAFDMGIAATNIEFSNGTIMPIDAAGFTAFSTWFVEKRNGYFV